MAAAVENFKDDDHASGRFFFAKKLLLVDA